MPLQRLRKTIRQANHDNRHLNHPTPNLLRLPPLHVQTRHRNRKQQNHKHHTHRVPNRLRLPRQMRPLQRPTKRPRRVHANPRRMLGVSQSAPM